MTTEKAVAAINPWTGEKIYADVQEGETREQTSKAVAAWAGTLTAQNIDPRQEARRLGIPGFQKGQRIRYGIATNPDGDHYGVIESYDSRAGIVTARRHDLPDDEYSKAKASGTVDTLNLTLIKEVYPENDFPAARERVDAFTDWIASLLSCV